MTNQNRVCCLYRVSTGKQVDYTITIKGETYTAELTPKFDDFSGHENYYKLLEDFNTYDCISEQAAPQGDVQQIYPEDFDKILTAELKSQEGQRQKHVANQAFDKAMGEIETYLKSHTKADTVFYAEQHGVKLGAKDKKLSAEDKKKLAELRNGTRFKMPKAEQIYTEYNKPISEDDIATLRTIGKISVNAFTSEDIQKAQKWAYMYKELKVKSPFFRAWFGDWRAFEKNDVTIAEIPQYFDSNEERKKNRGAVDNEDTSWTISISREGETNTISHAGKERLSEYGLAGIKELIRHAKLLNTEVHEHHNNNAKNDLIAFDHKLYALGKNEKGEVALYRITVEDYFQSKKQPSNKRFHNLKHIEKIADITGGRTSGKNRSGGSTDGKSAITYTVADLVKFVNMYDSEYISPKQSSVVVENGEPLVVYHGTKTSNIKTFRTINANGTGGLYLSTNRSVAEGFAGKNGEVYETYVNLRNPFIVDAGLSFYDSIAVCEAWKGRRTLACGRNAGALS